MKTKIGRICTAHPELAGLRTSPSGNCVECRRRWLRENRDKVAVWKKRHHDKYPDRRRAYTKTHRLRCRFQRPRWASWEEIRAVYKKAQTLGKTVDHFYPLKGKLVSGLHCPANMRIVSMITNRKKGNKYAP